MLVILGMMRCGHFDPCELFRRRPVFMHVTHRGQCIHVDRNGTIRQLERALGRGRRRPGFFAARLAREGDQGNVTLVQGDRLGSMGDMNQVRRAARFGGIDVSDLQSHIVDHGERTHSDRVAAAEVTVDIGEREPRILERAPGALHVQLRDRLLVCLA